MTDKLGRIEKGQHLSRNTEFKKGERRSRKTEFKKGYLSPGIISYPVGCERVMGNNIRVKLPNGKWEYKKRIVYEKHYGKVKNGDVILFIDKNTKNIVPENLISVSRAELVIIKRWSIDTNDKDINLTIILYAKLLVKIKNMSRIKNNDNQ